VAALASGQSLREAFRIAVAAGSAAVLSAGTELCSEEDVQRLLPRVKVSQVILAPA
jgi:6-phosphofructokinase 2